MERIAPNKYRLSTGREFSCHAGLISLVRTPTDGFAVGGGYDDMLHDAYIDPDRWLDPDEPDPTWTVEERRELADFMIAQWTAFKDSNGNG